MSARVASVATQRTSVMRIILRRALVGVGLVLLTMVTGAGVAAAARADVLVPAAGPFAVALVLVLRVLGAANERAGWGVFTAWLGTTYLQTGGAVEVGALVVYVSAAILGAVVSPWAFVVVWGAHPLWDLLPRTLPTLLADLPVACVVFDGVVAMYLGWSAWRGRWTRPGAPLAEPRT